MAARLQRPEMLAVARKKVSVAEIQEPPNSEGAPVPGRAKTRRSLAVEGSPQNPMTHKELEHKFMDLVNRVPPDEQAAC
jgi:hypothetical protein